ncbi:MAG: T9SS type A sorting domain-containing protein [Bacteroidales bacterium]|nr:T9SS type A sorting domain-containing protein [Bacteroidales bacterium]
MKKQLLSFLFMFVSAVVFAQTITLTFTAQDAGNHHVQLSRVIVSNLTKGWQETLLWPDTVLVMSGTGIGDFETFQETSLRLSQNNPNPFDGTTFVNMQVAEPGDVSVEITDITGRIVETFHETSLQPGCHSLRITLSSPGIYFLTARQDGRTASVKMVNRGNGGGNAIAFTNTVGANHYSPLPPQPKTAQRGATDNPFEAGDRMEYVGYAVINAEEVESNHVVQEQNASQTVLLTFSDLQSDGQPCPGTPTVTDHEGNVYATVQIGDQCWMRDNLRTTTSPSTGTYLIPAASTGHTCTGQQARWYNNDSATYAPMNYGLLYNWNAAVDTFNTAYGETSVNTSYSNAVYVTFTGHRRGICPAGWHLPSDAEWTQLENYVGSQSEYTCSGNSSYIAKALASTEGWNTDTYNCVVGNDPSSNNATGFSAVPAGACYGSSFYYAGSYAYFWSSTQDYSSYACYRYLTYLSAYVYWNNESKNVGYSVRCLRD